MRLTQSKKQRHGETPIHFATLSLAVYAKTERGTRFTKCGVGIVAMAQARFAVGGMTMPDSHQTDPSAASEGKIDRPVPPNPALDPASFTRLSALLEEMLDKAFAKALANFEVALESRPASKPLEPPPTASETGLDLKPRDRTRASDLRLALLMGKIPDRSPGRQRHAAEIPNTRLNLL